jgi:hypothetical protein
LEDLRSQLSLLSETSKKWTSDLGEVVTSATTAREIGERLVSLPHRSQEVANELGVALEDANTAIESSIERLKEVGEFAEKQLEVVIELAQHGKVVTDLASDLSYATTEMTRREVRVQETPISAHDSEDALDRREADNPGENY